MQLTYRQQGLSIPTDQEMLSREATTSLVIPVYSALLQDSDSNLPSNATPGDPINLLTTNYRVNAALPNSSHQQPYNVRRHYPVIIRS